jgi:hypothetical protein
MQIVRETLSQKSQSQKWAGGVAQGVDSEFKPYYRKKKKKKKEKEKIVYSKVMKFYPYVSSKSFIVLGPTFSL